MRSISLVLLSSTVFGTCTAQLAAPTAISDFGFSECSGDACMFVPDDEHPQTYKHGPYSYSVHEDGTFTVWRGATASLSTKLKDLSASVFVVWSADGNWLAVTWSDGGAIGNFHTRVFRTDPVRFTETIATDIAFHDFSKRHFCKARGDNVQAYGWDAPTGGLVLVLSVYPTGDCGRDLGHTEAYLVNPANGAIVRHLSGDELNQYMKAHPVP